MLRQIESLEPALAVIDSIQTIHDGELEPAAGSITQVRQCAAPGACQPAACRFS
jgi:DNA repair protein RadA/Sms